MEQNQNNFANSNHHNPINTNLNYINSNSNYINHNPNHTNHNSTYTNNVNIYNNQPPSQHHNLDEKESLKNILRELFFEGENNTRKTFEVVLTLLIFASIITVILETINPIHDKYGVILLNLEWFFTIIFTIEYLLRVYTSKKFSNYVFSYSGIIDFLAVIPLYMTLIFTSSSIYQLVRILRLVRVYSRLVKLGNNMNKAAISIKSFTNFLGSDEEIQLFLRTSRKKYFFRYLSLYIIIVAIIIGIGFDIFTSITLFKLPIVKISYYLIIILCGFYLMKLELEIYSKRYAITGHRILSSTGIIHEHFNSTSYKYVTDITIRQRFIEKLFNIGTVEIKTTGNSEENIKLDDISNPLKIKKLIHSNFLYN